MDQIAPRLDLFLLPPKCEVMPVNGPQQEYQDLLSIITPDGRVVSQWVPDAGELEMLKNGAPVTLVMHTFGTFKITPVQVAIGGMDLR